MQIVVSRTVSAPVKAGNWFDNLVKWVKSDMGFMFLLGLIGIVFQADWLYKLAILLGIYLTMVKVQILLLTRSRDLKFQSQRAAETRQSLVLEIRAVVGEIVGKQAEGTNRRIETIWSLLEEKQDAKEKV